MRVYWYWPHPHATASPLALATLRAGDELTVQALSSLHGRSFGVVRDYTVVRDLPDPTSDFWAAHRYLPRRIMLALGRSRARRRLLRRRFDVAHIETLSYPTDWLDLRYLPHSPPLVSMVHDVRPHRSHLPTAVESRLLRLLYRAAGHLVVYHEVLKDELLGDFNVDPQRVHVLPIPFESVVDPTLGGGSETPLLLLFGSLRPNKGIHVLIQSLEMLRDVEFSVIVAGDGPDELRYELQEAAARLPCLELELGFVTDERKRELFRSATAVLLPYTSFHSQSGVLADAYAYGLPVIASDIGAIGPTVRDDSTGIVIEPNDPEQLADAMRSLVERPDAGWPTAIAEASRRHSYSSVGARLREVYELAARH